MTILSNPKMAAVHETPVQMVTNEYGAVATAQWAVQMWKILQCEILWYIKIHNLHTRLGKGSEKKRIFYGLLPNFVTSWNWRILKGKAFVRQSERHLSCQGMCGGTLGEMRVSEDVCWVSGMFVGVYGCIWQCLGYIRGDRGVSGDIWGYLWGV